MYSASSCQPSKQDCLSPNLRKSKGKQDEGKKNEAKEKRDKKKKGNDGKKGGQKPQPSPADMSKPN